jgi:uncharacterized protein (DUF486 family)
MTPALKATLLLLGSNVFMTFAWYAHLKNLRTKPLVIAIAVSWGIALFEYMLQVPANRIGSETLSLGQLKILQEVITLAVFAPFAVLYMRQPLKVDFLWAGLCLVGAVYFVFRTGSGT